MLKQALITLSIASIAALAPAQSCGTLAANGSGAPGNTLTLDLTGSTADALAALAVGDTLGTTTFNIGPLGTLDLGIEMPFIPVPLGFTDSNGDASLAIDVPSTATQGIDLHAQAVAMDFSFGPGGPALNFCVSNTVSFHLGP